MKFPDRIFLTSRGVLVEDEGRSYLAFESVRDAIRYLDGFDLGWAGDPASTYSNTDEDIEEDLVEYRRVNKEVG